MKMPKAKMNAYALRQCMAKERVNQRKLAEASDVSEATLSLLMTGKRTPSLETVQSIAQALNMSESEFYKVFNSKEEAE